MPHDMQNDLANEPSSDAINEQSSDPANGRSSDRMVPSNDLVIGCHLSSGKGYEAMARTAQSIGANTFAFFTRNPRGGAAKAIDPTDIEQFEKACKEIGMGTIVAHGSYTINPCSAKESVREFALQALTDDLARMEFTLGQLFNMHPGSHTGQGVEVGIDQIAEILNQVITPDQTTTLLLETMAGKGSEVGSTFEELAAIRERMDRPEKVGICLDTCHVWDAGYDIKDDLDGVLERFDEVIGFEHLKALHVNDSLNSCGSHKDRHARIGEGEIGADALVRVLEHPALQGLPCILETPNELDGYAREIAFFREAVK